MRREIAIIGGGMAGLETAVSLISQTPNSPHITVFERNSSPYPTDQKINTGSGNGWMTGGGLAENLGGRSRKYQGVLLEVESQTLKDWPLKWQQKLIGQHGRYAQVRDNLQEEFTEIENRQLNSQAATELGLIHVPQGARLDSANNQLTIYSPYETAIRLSKTTDSLSITSGKVQRIKREPNGLWTVETIDTAGNTYKREGFAACVLAASAIGNIQILSESLGEEIQTRITDHFSLGAIVHLPPGEPLDTFRHERLWSGYIAIPELGTNIFVQEMKPLPNDDRMIDICAVIEQGSSRQDYSTLIVTPTETHIETKISQADKERLSQVKQKLENIIHKISQGAPEDLTTEDISYESALTSTLTNAAGSFRWYSFPYGAFEHESATHPIGENGLISVTNDLTVQELPGLYLAGPGNFPRPGAANPSLTIYAMSHVLAETIDEA